MEEASRYLQEASKQSAGDFPPQTERSWREWDTAVFADGLDGRGSEHGQSLRIWWSLSVQPEGMGVSTRCADVAVLNAKAVALMQLLCKCGYANAVMLMVHSKGLDLCHVSPGSSAEKSCSHLSLELIISYESESELEGQAVLHDFHLLFSFFSTSSCVDDLMDEDEKDRAKR